MATVHGILSARLQDAYGVKTAHNILCSLSDATTLAQLITDAQAYFALLDPVTDAAGVGGHFTLNMDSTGLKTSVAVVNTVDKGGLFSFDAAGTPYNASVLVPCFAEAKKTGSHIDLGDSDVLAWITWIEGGGTYLKPESRGYQDLQSFLKCKYVARKHRKSESQLSMEVPES